MRNLAVIPLVLVMACAKSTTPAAPTEASSADADVNSAVAASVESALDRSADPCQDFYQFACGGWAAKTTLPADRPIFNRSFSAIYDENQAVVREVLQQAKGSETADPRLGAFWDSCMAEDAVQAQAAEGLMQLREAVQQLNSSDAVMAFLATRASNGALFGGFIEADFQNPDINILHVAQGGLGLPNRDYYFPEDDKGKKILEDYTEHIVQMMVLAGVDAEEAAKGAEHVLAIETTLAEASKPPAAMRDVMSLYHKDDLEGLQKLTPHIDWAAYFAAAGVPGLTSINIMTPEFFPVLDGIMAEENFDALQAYVLWHEVHGTATSLGKSFDEETFGFYGRNLNGQQEQQPRWRRCVSMTDGALGDLLGQAYVDRAFAGESKIKAQAMIKDIQDAFRARVPELAWMDPETQKKALEKLGTITDKIGYPDKWESYEGLEIGDNFYANMRAIDAWNLRQELGKVGQPVDKSEWHMSPPTVNAYYNPLVNEIVFPAGIMQAPFFDASFPAAMNYGAMGMVMGHEVTHGFDDEGRKFAPDGSLQEWWSPSAVEAFEGAAQCIEKQYDSYEVQPGVFVNGKLTLGENIADLGGLRLASEAYNGWAARNGAEPTLAGFTPDQQLYVAFAQAWCTVASPEVERYRIENDSHSPPRFRVNGTVSATPSFGEAFSCEVGTPMRPESVCEVW